MSDYKYEKCVDCVHAHMNKDGNHDCGFEDCVSESDKRYPDDTPFESYCSCYDCFQKMVCLENEAENLKLRKENKELRDNYEQYKAVAEPEIDALKNEIVNLKGVIESLSEQRDRLEKENAELKEQNANLIAMLKSEREVRVNDDYLKGICEKEAEIGKLEGKVQDWTSEYYELENFMNNKLAKAKELVKELVDTVKALNNPNVQLTDIDNHLKNAEEFLGKEE